MSNRTFKTILFLVGLLFLNIEAAKAGLLNRFKYFIHSEFNNEQLAFLSIGFVLLAGLLYVMFAPVAIGNQKSIWLDYSPKAHKGGTYQSKRDQVKRISLVLNNKMPD
ncbi:MAG: hypothetical protein IT236_01445 [Bacteroidia bacterium]|nr:hypothetical protein [Bacteroidia bacterium]